MIHMVAAYKNGLCSTKCGLISESWFSCTGWWRDVTCPECRVAIGYEFHVAPLVDAARAGKSRPKRRKFKKVPA